MPTVGGLGGPALEQLLSSIAAASPTLFSNVSPSVIAAAARRLKDVADGAVPSRLPESSVPAAKAAIQEVINAGDLVIFTAKVGDPSAPKDCPYCAKALNAIKEAGISFKHEQVGMKGTPSRLALQELAGGIGSVPVGYCMQTLLGGYDETDGDKGDGYGIMPLLGAGKIQAALEQRNGTVIR